MYSKNSNKCVVSFNVGRGFRFGLKVLFFVGPLNLLFLVGTLNLLSLVLMRTWIDDDDSDEKKDSRELPAILLPIS